MRESRPTPGLPARSTALAVMLAVAAAMAMLAACSKVAAILPDGREPVCGPGIHRGAVRVLDMTGFERDEARITAGLDEEIGAYRIMTDEPVWIPKRSAEGENDHSGSIATVQAIAGEWGCNLLILLDSRMDRTSVRTQSRNEDRVWLVLAGRLGDSG